MPPVAETPVGAEVATPGAATVVKIPSAPGVVPLEFVATTR